MKIGSDLIKVEYSFGLVLEFLKYLYNKLVRLWRGK